jgi:hypothetical protein
VRASVTATLALAFLALAVSRGLAQVPPLPAPPPKPHIAPPPLPAPGFVSSYEILHTLRSAGFDPLAPPLREGAFYVARATDYRGILMRVVLDARTGAIRDANRIVPNPGSYAWRYGGAYGEGPYRGRYGPPPYGARFYGPRPYGPEPYGRTHEANVPAATLAAPTTTGAGATPLPRPRPPELASRKPAVETEPAGASDAKSSAAIDPKPDVTPSGRSASPVPVPAAQTAISTEPAKPDNAPATLSIKN